MSSTRRGLIWQMVLPIPIVTVIGLAVVWFTLPDMIADDAREASVNSAVQTANQFKTVRGYYTKNVISKVVKSGTLKPSFNHKTEPDGVPLPATFIHDMSALLKAQDTSVSLFSGFPFPVRGARELDPFQREAWAFLAANPDEVFVRQEKRDGHSVVRVAIADKMTAQGCVNCHNSHPASPKTDWKLGDVRGVLEVSNVIDGALAAGNSLSNFIMMGGVAAALILVLISFFVARKVSQPIGGMTRAMSQLAEGDTEVEIPSLGRRDEIGAMAETLKVFKEGITEKERLQAERLANEEQARADENRRNKERQSMIAEKERLLAEQMANEEQARAEQDRRTKEKGLAEVRQAEERQTLEQKGQEERRQAMLDLASEFEHEVGGVIGAVATAAKEMQSSARTLSANAEATSSQTEAVASASDEASSNVKTVAESAEELSSSIQEISRQVTQSTAKAHSAVQEAARTNERVQSLAESAEKVGAVVSLINDIASQTNLLALNATIESARAGDAGKGFAVVAHEVKSLADQTAKATDEIANQIAAMQASTGETVVAIGEIGSTIGEINDIASNIAAAVEEQGAATQEIAGSVAMAASSTESITTKITAVSEAACQTGGASGQMLSAAEDLSAQANILERSVGVFLEKVRAA